MTHVAVPPRSKSYTIYQLSNGLITGSLICTGIANCTDTLHDQIAGLYSSNTNFVNVSVTPHVITARPAMSIVVNKTNISANGIDAATFTGVLDGTSVSIDSATPQNVTSTSMTFTTSDAGTYTLDFSNFPYLDQTFQVIAT